VDKGGSDLERIGWPQSILCAEPCCPAGDVSRYIHETQVRKVDQQDLVLARHRGAVELPRADRQFHYGDGRGNGRPPPSLDTGK